MRVYFDRETSQFVGITPALLEQLRSQYPVDIEHELKRMTNWLLSKGKTRKGTLIFIRKWLSESRPVDACQALILRYLHNLWTGRESLLTFNES